MKKASTTEWSLYGVCLHVNDTKTECWQTVQQFCFNNTILLLELLMFKNPSTSKRIMSYTIFDSPFRRASCSASLLRKMSCPSPSWALQKSCIGLFQVLSLLERFNVPFFVGVWSVRMIWWSVLLAQAMLGKSDVVSCACTFLIWS